MTTNAASHAAFGRYAAEARRRPVLGRDEEHRLLRAAAAGDESARTRLIESNLGLVIAVARRYRGLGLDVDDLVQEGNLGLIAAVRRHDPGTSVRFGAFAEGCVRRAICRALTSSSRVIRIPARVRAQASALLRAEDELAQQLGRPPTRQELSRQAGVGEEGIDALRCAGRRPRSLSEPVGDDGDGSLADVIRDERAHDPAVLAEAAAEQAGVSEALGALGERPRRVLQLRYGLGGREAQTLDVVAGRLGVSRERVRTIEVAALRTLSARAELSPRAAA